MSSKFLDRNRERNLHNSQTYRELQSLCSYHWCMALEASFTLWCGRHARTTKGICAFPNDHDLWYPVRAARHDSPAAFPNGQKASSWHPLLRQPTTCHLCLSNHCAIHVNILCFSSQLSSYSSSRRVMFPFPQTKFRSGLGCRTVDPKPTASKLPKWRRGQPQPSPVQCPKMTSSAGSAHLLCKYRADLNVTFKP